MAEASFEASRRIAGIDPEEQWEQGSLGSAVLALRGGHPDLLRRKAELYGELFRKSWVDLRGGLAVFMAPTCTHEEKSLDSDGLVKSLGRAMGISVISLGSTTIGPSGRGGEPDKSFYIGEKAEVLRKMREAGAPPQEREAWVSERPADLVIEVEHTHYDKAKRGLYKAAGVAEMWELATPQSGRPSVILDLRRSVDPQSLFSSNLLPGVVAGRLNEALLLLERLGGHDEILERGQTGEGRLTGSFSRPLASGPIARAAWEVRKPKTSNPGML